MALSYLKNVYVRKTHTCLGLISIHVVLRLRIVTQSSFTISALNTSAHSQAACNYRRQISGFDKQRRRGTCDLLTSQPWTTTPKTSWNKHRKNTVMIPRVIHLQQTNQLTGWARAGNNCLGSHMEITAPKQKILIEDRKSWYAEREKLNNKFEKNWMYTYEQKHTPSNNWFVTAYTSEEIFTAAAILSGLGWDIYATFPSLFVCFEFAMLKCGVNGKNIDSTTDLTWTNERMWWKREVSVHVTRSAFTIATNHETLQQNRRFTTRNVHVTSTTVCCSHERISTRNYRERRARERHK